MSVGFKAHDGSGYENPRKVRDAEEFILNHIELDHSVDVPFCAGVSEDGQTLYVDHAIYDELEKLGYLRPLCVHELVEHALMRMLGMKYDDAHAIATGAEESCLRADGIDKTTYNRNWNRLIRKVQTRGEYPNVPEDLDTEPYNQDDERAEEEGKLDHGLFGGGKASYGC